jgi:hypothetical protein
MVFNLERHLFFPCQVSAPLIRSRKGPFLPNKDGHDIYSSDNVYRSNDAFTSHDMAHLMDMNGPSSIKGGTNSNNSNKGAANIAPSTRKLSVALTSSLVAAKLGHMKQRSVNKKGGGDMNDEGALNPDEKSYDRGGASNITAPTTHFVQSPRSVQCCRSVNCTRRDEPK